MITFTYIIFFVNNCINLEYVIPIIKKKINKRRQKKRGENGKLIKIDMKKVYDQKI